MSHLPFNVSGDFTSLFKRSVEDDEVSVQIEMFGRPEGFFYRIELEIVLVRVGGVLYHLEQVGIIKDKPREMRQFSDIYLSGRKIYDRIFLIPLIHVHETRDNEYHYDDNDTTANFFHIFLMYCYNTIIFVFSST